jgi:hypothetical protein
MHHPQLGAEVVRLHNFRTDPATGELVPIPLDEAESWAIQLARLVAKEQPQNDTDVLALFNRLNGQVGS